MDRYMLEVEYKVDLIASQLLFYEAESYKAAPRNLFRSPVHADRS